MPLQWAGVGTGRQQQAHAPSCTRRCRVGTQGLGCGFDPAAPKCQAAGPGSSPAQESANPLGRQDRVGSQDGWLWFR